jgi:hypothetical protein
MRADAVNLLGSTTWKEHPVSTTATTRTIDRNEAEVRLFVSFELGEKEDTRDLLEKIGEAHRGQRGSGGELLRGRSGRLLVAPACRRTASRAASSTRPASRSIAARRRKSDRPDAEKLLSMLLREALGEGDLSSVVNVPSPADEDARSLQREYRTLVKERTRSAKRIRSALLGGLVQADCLAEPAK